MPSGAEVLRDGTIGREEPLGVPCRLKSLHPPFPLAGRLVGVFRTVIQIPVLAVLHARQDLPLGRPIAFELVRDDHPRHIPAALEQLAEEFLGRVLVPPTLDQDIQDMTVLIHRPPEIVACATNRQEYLIQVPLVPGLSPASPRHNILYSGGELTRPCLPNIRLTRTQSCTAHRRQSSMYESQGV